MSASTGGRVAGKRAFITGGAQGLGACFARMLAGEGARVFVTDVNAEGAAATAAAVNDARPGTAFAHALDVTDRDGWETALSEANAAMGGIDVLINNAGIASFASVEDEAFETFRRVQAVNVDAVFTGVQLAMRFLRASQPASIINISSVSGMIADARQVSYNTSKAAVWMMTKSIALHCARQGIDVRCNSVHPVFTRTPIIDPLIALGGGGEEGEARLVKNIPLRRLAEPEDVGYCVLYLASDESRFVTASEFKIDGGLTAA
ncbi:MAG: SDR family oxidoreductase [Pseudomonadota bacterium]